MDPATQILLVIFTVAAALSLFAMLILFGAWLLRRMGIEADPPEIYRFRRQQHRFSLLKAPSQIALKQLSEHKSAVICCQRINKHRGHIPLGVRLKVLYHSSDSKMWSLEATKASRSSNGNRTWTLKLGPEEKLELPHDQGAIKG